MLNFLFLGASKRYEAANILLSKQSQFTGPIEIYSIESDPADHYAISHLAHVISGPAFDSEGFDDILDNLIIDLSNPVIVPFMDSALSKLSEYVAKRNYSRAVVSLRTERFTDKNITKDIASKFGIGTVGNTPNRWPKVIKPVKGFGSRGIRVVEKDSRNAIDSLNLDEWIIEDYIGGIEISVDAYFDRNSSLISCIARERLRVEAGEVMRTRTRDVTQFEFDAVKFFEFQDLKGPVNFQFIFDADQELLLEINSRFSGGSTASMAAGWDAWSWIISEYALGNPIVLHDFAHVDVTRSRKDHVRSI